MSLKLTDDELKKTPSDVFQIDDSSEGKIGEGSYGSVFKAPHKETGIMVAIKKVEINNDDFQDIVKEIKFMFELCGMENVHNPHIVDFYGSFLTETALWIVMEYCAAGSISDMMKYTKETLNEQQISCVLKSSLEGLAFLHADGKIHRDIKAANILMNDDGLAKLADFGVSGQLTETMAKRNTVIGTPFWMAPEVIQEVGYDTKADIWSIGITALEMFDGKPPLGHIHPMRVIFLIASQKPPEVSDKGSADFKSFVAACLVKDQTKRPSATELLEHPFIKNSAPQSVLVDLIKKTTDYIAAGKHLEANDDEEAGTMLPGQTMKQTMDDDAGGDDDYGGTMVMNATVKGANEKASFMRGRPAQSNLQTLIKAGNCEAISNLLAELKTAEEKEIATCKEKFARKRAPILEALADF